MSSQILPPFRTKKAVRDAMTLGSRWAMNRLDSDDDVTGTVVRASSTSRWIVWDHSGDMRPTWIPVGDTKGWDVDENGFTETSSGVRLSFVAPPPADLDEAHMARLALPRNRRGGPCDECGGEVAARAGHIRERWDREAERRVWVALHPYGECAPASAPVSSAA